MGSPVRTSLRIGFTAEMARSRFRYDTLTGDLYWRIEPGRGVQIGDRAYSVTRGRKTVRIPGGRVPQTHVVWLMHKGMWPSGEVDHRDRDQANDRIGNLRDTTTKKNCMNQTVRKHNKCGFKGVTKHPQQNAYWCRISADGVRYQLGLYPTAEMAAAAYRIAAACMHGEYSGV